MSRSKLSAVRRKTKHPRRSKGRMWVAARPALIPLHSESMPGFAAMQESGALGDFGSDPSLPSEFMVKRLPPGH